VTTQRLARVIVVSSLLAWGIFFGKLTTNNYQLSTIVFADEIDDLQHQIDELAKLKKLSEDATTPLEKQVTDLDKKIKSAQAGIANAQKQSEEAGKQIASRENTIGAVYSIFSQRVAQKYRTMGKIDPFVVILSSKDLSTLTNTLTYQFKAAQQDSQELTRLASEIQSLESDKK
jgi:peptidoglycan hydrolase CwlO-like protein